MKYYGAPINKFYKIVPFDWYVLSGLMMKIKSDAMG